MYITFFQQNLPNYNTLFNNNYLLNTYAKNTKIITETDLTPEQTNHIASVECAITQIHNRLNPFKNKPVEELFYEFKIPKHSGGLRTINAPYTDFKLALTDAKEIFERDIKCLAHNAAYAYTKNRCTLDAIQVHQKNQSNWFLKIDLKDFFPSCTPELIFNQLLKIYPFACIHQNAKNQLKEIIEICCLNNGLPQGTPMSPILTNLIMVPYDYQLQQLLTRGTGEHYVYTRYADDILISSKNQFNWQELTNQIKEILQPFNINTAKIRYGNKAGRNWNLGLMLNKDNNITLGFKEKKLLNAMLNNFLKDFKNNNPWSIEDTQHLQGKLSYLNQIEPTYWAHLINKYNLKYNTSYTTALKTILS